MRAIGKKGEKIGRHFIKIKDIFRITEKQRIFASLILLFVSLYAAVALYTPWTGSLGAQVSRCLLKSVGGAVIIPLLFLSYLSISSLLSKNVPNVVRQALGTVLIFVLASILLGLNEITSYGRTPPNRWLAAGKFGIFAAKSVFSSLGAVGTFMFGSVIICSALYLYNIPAMRIIKLPKLLILQKWRAKIDDSGRKKTTSYDVGTAAPNITAFTGTDYFGQTAGNEDMSPMLDRMVMPAAVAEGAGDDAAVRDPEFNLKKTADKKRVEKGLFPPPIDIFGNEELRNGDVDEEKAMPLGEKIIDTLEQFNIEARLAEILVGPTVIQFRIQLAPGIKVSRVAALANDIALAMAVPSLRIEAPIPGKPFVGIEIPNPKRRGIPFRTIMENPLYSESGALLPLPFGITVSGDVIVVGLESLPHLLVAGTTGSGKSVFINSCIAGLCSMRTPEEVRMILVDPKRVEMAIYDKLPHLLTPPVTDTKKAVRVLAWAIREMEARYASFAKTRVRNIEGFNKKALPKDKLPNIVIVVDELADLMMTAPKEVEEYICRLAQMARATGIHLILATQRPSVNVITGLIKANIPARVAFTLPSNADSRTILDCAGAEKLLGKGDMLFLSTKYPKPIRIQSPWIDEKILGNWLDYLANIFGEPDFIDIDNQSGAQSFSDGSSFDDEMLEDAIETVLSTGIASASGLQRRLRVGFSRASRLIDMMEQIGIVGPADGARPREILVDAEDAQKLLDNVRNCY